MKLIDADAINYAIMFDGYIARLGVYKDEIDKMPSVQPESDPEWRKRHYESAYAQGFVDGCKSYERQPERRKGEWLLNGGRRCECSICHHEGNIYGNANFCEHCGADMRGEQNG